MHEDTDIANFADGNTSYTSTENVNEIIESLEQASASLFKLFELKILKGNADKCYLFSYKH